MLHPVGSTMSHRMRGGTLLGFLVGLVFGLSLAVDAHANAGVLQEES